MPIEMRELIIKTEIKSQSTRPTASLGTQDLKALRQQIIEECLRIFKDKAQRDSFNR